MKRFFDGVVIRALVVSLLVVTLATSCTPPGSTTTAGDTPALESSATSTPRFPASSRHRGDQPAPPASQVDLKTLLAACGEFRDPARVLLCERDVLIKAGDGSMTASEMPDPSLGMCRGHRVTIVGTPDDDVLTGTVGRDVIAALAGSDVIRALDGLDLVCAGAGDDEVHGGDGDDGVYGAAGSDRLVGGAGEDYLDGAKGEDGLRGGDGDDFLVHGDWYHGGRGDDAVDLSREGPLHVDLRAFVARTANGIRRVVHVEDIIGSRYDDVLIGDADENSLDGALGDDQLYGHGGHDLLVAGPSTGVLGERPTKGTSNDQLFGGSGSDELSGRIGGVFSGGDGNDSVTVHAIGGFPGTSADGGRGLDTFVFTTNALKEVEVTIDLARERFVSDVWPRLVGWAGHVEGTDRRLRERSRVGVQRRHLRH